MQGGIARISLAEVIAGSVTMILAGKMADLLIKRSIDVCYQSVCLFQRSDLTVTVDDVRQRVTCKATLPEPQRHLEGMFE